MTEDHSWAGDTRLIPPDGASVPSQHDKTRGTPNREARGGVVYDETASNIGKNTWENVTARKAQGATDNNDTKNVTAQESQGANGKNEKENVTACKTQGAIDNVTAQESQGASKNVTACKTQGAIGNVTAQESQGASSNVTAQESQGASNNVTAQESQGAIIEIEIGNVTAYREQGATGVDQYPRRMMGRSKFERIESIAKEGVRQSKICSGIDPRMKCRMKSKCLVPRNFIYFYLVRNIIFVRISSHKYF